MNKRPTSIAIVGWVLIVLGGISLITSSLSLNNPMAKELMSRSPIPITIQYVMMFAGLIVTFVSGIAILKGKNWARLLYVIWSAVGLIIGIATSPMKSALIPGIVVFVIIAFFLFRPKANEYFTGAGAVSVPQSS